MCAGLEPDFFIAVRTASQAIALAERLPSRQMTTSGPRDGHHGSSRRFVPPIGPWLLGVRRLQRANLYTARRTGDAANIARRVLPQRTKAEVPSRRLLPSNIGLPVIRRLPERLQAQSDSTSRSRPSALASIIRHLRRGGVSMYFSDIWRFDACRDRASTAIRGSARR